MQLSKIRELESCFLVTLSQVDVMAIESTPFKLACNDVLAVGDCFTEIGSSGSAGNQPVKVSSPWVQRYQGMLRAKQSHFEWLPDNWADHDLVLFDAFNPTNKKEGYVSPSKRAQWQGTRTAQDGYFMAYLRHCDDQLFHTRGGSSSSVCKCTSLTRWHAPLDDGHNAQARGAYLTHSLRVDKTERKIIDTIERFKAQKQRITKAAISREIAVSREHLHRRYAHLFAD